MDGNTARTIRCVIAFCARRFPRMCSSPPPSRGNFPACACSAWTKPARCTIRRISACPSPTTSFPIPASLRRGNLRSASTQYPDEIRLVYLRLPHTIDPRVSELARTLTASAANNYDRAVAIQSYLRNNFQYTLDPPAIEPEDPVGSFLFRSKSGYCEYFAAAMAVMLRTLNVPSRLVNGFQTGSYNRIGKDFVVRARDAHSWVEVYFTGYGWIPFDPTPADPASRSSRRMGRLR